MLAVNPVVVHSDRKILPGILALQGSISHDLARLIRVNIVYTPRCKPKHTSAIHKMRDDRAICCLRYIAVSLSAVLYSAVRCSRARSHPSVWKFYKGGLEAESVMPLAAAFAP